MISLIADVHAHNFPKFGGALTSGVNKRGWYTVASIHKAVALANKRGDTAIVVAGDLFDDCKPTPQLMAAVMEAMRAFGGKWWVLKGNHDEFSTSEGDHALGPLGHLFDVEVVEEPATHTIGGLRVLMLPFDQRPVGEWLPALLENLPGPVDILVGHFGIIDENTPPWLRDAPDAFESSKLLHLMRFHGITLAAVGNWHNAQTWTQKGCRIEQIGALTPTGFDNCGENYGCVLHVDAQGKASRSTVEGPRFHSLKWGAKLKATLTPSTYLSVEAKAQDMVEAREWLRAQEIGGFDLYPSKEEASAAARAAGESASKAATVLEAFDAYVQKMIVPEGVSRDAVVKRLKGYTKGALGA